MIDTKTLKKTFDQAFTPFFELIKSILPFVDYGLLKQYLILAIVWSFGAVCIGATIF